MKGGIEEGLVVAERVAVRIPARIPTRDEQFQLVDVDGENAE